MTSHTRENTVTLNDGHRLTGLREFRRRRDAGDTAADYGDVHCDTVLKCLVGCSWRRLHPDRRCFPV